MSGAATQIASRQFDADYFRLPAEILARIQNKMDEVGLRLKSFPHYRMAGSENYRLRIGDYRLIYRFDLVQGEIYWLAMGHRREIYRSNPS